jgi:hypothetical protein
MTNLVFFQPSFAASKLRAVDDQFLSLETVFVLFAARYGAIADECC